MPTLSVRIVVDPAAPPLVCRAAAILETRLVERTGASVVTQAPADRVIHLGIDPSIGTEGYRLEKGTSLQEVRVLGSEPRGVLYGVGRLLRDARMKPGVFEFGDWRGTSVPARPIRGMYFATHFFNYYHVAPLAEIERYLEDLALWGCNVLNVWFDMHHYTGIDDPKAVAMIARLKSILQLANGVGMGAGLTMLANEAYANSPEHLRAVPTPHHYRVELCPSKPEGLEITLKWRREVLETFADVNFDAVWIWPHDQGGCLCPQCAPWGGNGFLHVAKPIAALVRQHMPGAKIVLSTWCFDYFQKGEWQGLADAFTNKPDWVDYLMVDAHGDFPRFPIEQGVPGNLPMINFPEISMFKQTPWGGFGAIPAPDRFQNIWDTIGHQLQGGFPYSETIAEDMNKAINLMHYWSDQPALETIRQYARYEFGHDVAADVVQLCVRLEAQLEHYFNGHRQQEMFKQIKTDPSVAERLLEGRWYFLTAAERLGLLHAAQTLDLSSRIEARLSDHARRSWRWRLLRIRTELDHELVRSEGAATPASEALFEEIRTISHGHTADWLVRPPAIKRMLHDFGVKTWAW